MTGTQLNFFGMEGRKNFFQDMGSGSKSSWVEKIYPRNCLPLVPRVEFLEDFSADHLWIRIYQRCQALFQFSFSAIH